MRKLTIGILLLTSGFAQAEGRSYKCEEKTSDGGRDIVLTQDGNREMREGVREPFTLFMSKSGTDGPTRMISGFGQIEDVHLSFRSVDGKIEFDLYLDELDQAYLDLECEKSGEFACVRAAHE